MLFTHINIIELFMATQPSSVGVEVTDGHQTFNSKLNYKLIGKIWPIIQAHVKLFMWPHW